MRTWGCFMDAVPLSIIMVTCLTIFEEMLSHLDMSPRTTFRSLRTTLQPTSKSSDSPLSLWNTSIWRRKHKTQLHISTRREQTSARQLISPHVVTCTQNSNLEHHQYLIICSLNNYQPFLKNSLNLLGGGNNHHVSNFMNYFLLSPSFPSCRMVWAPRSFGTFWPSSQRSATSHLQTPSGRT